MGRLFGTDGVRGIANKELTPELAFNLGKAGAHVLKRENNKPVVVIGKDTRISGDMLENALTAGILAVGGNVIKAGVIPTPAVAYLARYYNADAGIVISASHNTFEYNGIKFFNGDGYKLDDLLEEKIEDIIISSIDVNSHITGDKIGKCLEAAENATELYADHLMSTVDFRLDGKKIVLDCANGAASSIAKTVFEMLGARTYMIHDEPDGLNINVDCGSTHIESLQKFVVEKGLDVGFAFDGDADRCFAVDEKGNVLDGDLIMYLCAVHMKERNALIDDTVVATIASNMGVEKALEKQGIRMKRTPVGDKYVSLEMQEHGYSIGGEESGHIIFNKYSTTGDGILTAIRVMEIIVGKKTMPSFLTAGVTLFPKTQINKRVQDAAAVLENPVVKEAIDQASLELDGSGRVLIRKSGTEPVIRILVEAREEEVCRKLAEQIAAKMEEAGQ